VPLAVPVARRGGETGRGGAWTETEGRLGLLFGRFMGLWCIWCISVRTMATQAPSPKCAAASSSRDFDCLGPSALRASAGGAKPRVVVGVGGCFYPRFYLRADCHPLPNSAAGEMESGRRPKERRAISIPAPSNEHCDIRVTGRRRARRALPV
jgi:hypothetical protein